MNEVKQNGTIRPLGRQLAQQLTAEQIDMVAGGGGASPAEAQLSKSVCAGVSTGGDVGVDAGLDW